MKQKFKFKKFSVEQHNCAMKIGTDGVLLGAWTTLPENINSILDVGSGTGLLALMLAQRTQAEIIDAIEIDEAAFEQCVQNFETSEWADRLFCYHAGFDEFVDEIEDKYDLIICNPPFFSEDVSSGNVSRDTARQNASLPFKGLLEGISKLLAKGGKFSVITTYKEESNFIEMASKNKLFPNRICRVRGNPSSKIKRSLMQFSFNEIQTEINELTIEKERHVYTKEYIALTKDFYLKM